MSKTQNEIRIVNSKIARSITVYRHDVLINGKEIVIEVFLFKGNYMTHKEIGTKFLETLSQKDKEKLKEILIKFK